MEDLQHSRSLNNLLSGDEQRNTNTSHKILEKIKQNSEKIAVPENDPFANPFFSAEKSFRREAFLNHNSMRERKSTNSNELLIYALSPKDGSATTTSFPTINNTINVDDDYDILSDSPSTGVMSNPSARKLPTQLSKSTSSLLQFSSNSPFGQAPVEKSKPTSTASSPSPAKSVVNATPQQKKLMQHNSSLPAINKLMQDEVERTRSQKFFFVSFRMGFGENSFAAYEFFKSLKAQFKYKTADLLEHMDFSLSEKPSVEQISESFVIEKASKIMVWLEGARKKYPCESRYVPKVVNFVFEKVQKFIAEEKIEWLKRSSSTTSNASNSTSSSVSTFSSSPAILTTSTSASTSPSVPAAKVASPSSSSPNMFFSSDFSKSGKDFEDFEFKYNTLPVDDSIQKLQTLAQQQHTQIQQSLQIPPIRTNSNNSSKFNHNLSNYNGTLNKANSNNNIISANNNVVSGMSRSSSSPLISITTVQSNKTNEINNISTTNNNSKNATSVYSQFQSMLNNNNSSINNNNKNTMKKLVLSPTPDFNAHYEDILCFSYMVGIILFVREHLKFLKEEYKFGKFLKQKPDRRRMLFE